MEITIQQLEEIMRKYGSSIHAVKLEQRQIMEKRHADRYNDGEIKYMEEFKREMFVRTYVPENAGKFYLKVNGGHFDKAILFDSINDIVKYLLEKENEQ